MNPTAQQVRRALARVERGATVNLEEAAALLGARGDDLTRLCDAAGRVRDAGLEAAGRPGVVTYSPKVFIPVTHLCRDRCHYCTFVTVPGKLAAQGRAPYLSPDEVVAVAARGAALGCKEALFTLGDRPEDRWPEARQWLDEHGYDSTLAYVRAMSIRVLEETGLLPHLNPGVMSWAEINRLKPVAPSMGMMLETTSRRLFEEKGQPHYGSPDKDPAVRLRVLEDAGRLSVPFTTGILVGIGETLVERAESLFAIRKVAQAYGHVQEVIVQNFRAKPDTAMRQVDDLGLEEYLAAVATARLVLGPKMRIQAPPNLVDLTECTALLAAGVDDWGGVSPLTPDHVNPERPWPSLDKLRAVTADAGFTLTERLTVHPEYVRAGTPWLDPRVVPHVAALATETGLAVAGKRPVGSPWQEPDPTLTALAGAGRTDLHATIDTHGRTTDRRTDFDAVYGDWDLLRDQVTHLHQADSDTVVEVRAERASKPHDPDPDAVVEVRAERASKPHDTEPGGGFEARLAPRTSTTDTDPSTTDTDHEHESGFEARLAPRTSTPDTDPSTTDTDHEHESGFEARLAPRTSTTGPAPDASTTDRDPDPNAVVEVRAERASKPLDRAVVAALGQAEADPRGLTDEQAWVLMTAEGEALRRICALADHLRAETVGDEVTYVVNRNINFTNVCYTGCRFCAFAQRRTDADAYSLSLTQVADRAEEAWGLGATEVCMQGGIDPDLPGTAYFDLVGAVKDRVPGMHVHAFSPMEIVNGASRTGLSIRDFLTAAKDAGLDTIPGTAAEILDDEVRWILTKGKLPTSAWIEVVTTAHELGIGSSSTMMYGHVDNPRHWVQHLRVLQRIQDQTGGFTEFVPLPFVHTSAPIYLAGVARPGPTLRDNLAVHAMARIMLHGRIHNIQTSWVKLGVDGTRAMLQAGANDLGGTLMEETISRMAGSEHGSAKTIAELTDIAAGINRPVRQRTTTYGALVDHRAVDTPVS